MNINYKKLFIRFLKEKQFYEKWNSLIRYGRWKNIYDMFFDIVRPHKFIEVSFTDDYCNTRKIKDIINLDFEWRIILYELDNDNKMYLIEFINSRYFSNFYIENTELFDRFKVLKNNITFDFF